MQIWFNLLFNFLNIYLTLALFKFLLYFFQRIQTLTNNGGNPIHPMPLVFREQGTFIADIHFTILTKNIKLFPMIPALFGIYDILAKMNFRCFFG